MVGNRLLSCLSYLNSLLCTLGVKPFSAHHLHLAADNDASATISVLSLLSDLVVFHLASAPPSSSPPPHSVCRKKDDYSNSQTAAYFFVEDEKLGQHNEHHCSGNMTQGPSPVNYLDFMAMPDANTISQEERLGFVKFYLALWGYAPSSPLFALKSTTSESRHLLLAVGWLVCHSDIFSRALETRFSSFLGYSPLITNNFLDASAKERGREVMVEARQYVERVVATSNSLGDSSRDKVKVQGEQLLMMCGRLGMTLRSLYALISCKSKRSHEMNQIQLLENVKGPDGHPFSPFELLLLEQDKTLEKYQMTLETAQCMIKELVECNQQERSFWQWMGEVAAEARQQKHIIMMDEQLSSTSGGLETNLLPILTYFRNKLDGKCSAQEPSHVQRVPTSEGNDSYNKVASQVDDISTPVITFRKDIQERESQARLMSYFGTNNQIESFNSQLLGIFSSHRHLLLREESRRPPDIQCLDRKQVKSVNDVATTLLSTLAKIRTKNKAIIQEALKMSMAKKDHFFAGV